MKPIEKLNEELKTAMKNKDAVRLSVIRMLKNKILQVNARGEVTDDEAVKLYQNYAKSLKETIEIAKQTGKSDMLNETLGELKIVEEFLPQQLSADEVTAIATAVVATIGKDKTKFGLIMKEVVAKVAGRADGAIVKDAVSQLLQ